ncbi:PP2C family protein-serine/threonine phosphatase [Kocuria sp. M1N1S27]|uniref:PP2C family protein-serine/threonine phosphatase n=1 Tax=Kocuria kalidii TaxID=3376283 RepID=UPI00379429AD
MSAGVLDDEELARAEALHALGVLDTPPESRYDQVVQLAENVFDVPMAAVNLVDTDRQWTKAQVGLNGVENLPLIHSMCRYTVQQSDMFIVPDTAADERFHDNRFVRKPPYIRFYAGHPLRAPGGEHVGALCLFDTHPRHLSAAEQRILRQMAGWLEKELTFHRELERAGQVQQLLMPRLPPKLPGYQLAGRCTPTWEIGGDFYDWHLVGQALQLHVADVMGKGIPAALIAASGRAALRGAAQYNDQQHVIAHAAAVLEEQLEDTASFITAFSARIDPSTGDLTYIDAGHGLAVIFDTAGGHRRLKSSGPPLGVLPGTTWKAHSTTLAPGETLLVVSDGFLDSFTDLDSAIIRAANVVHEAVTAEQIIERFTAYAQAHAHTDDVTVVALHRDPA